MSRAPRPLTVLFAAVFLLASLLSSNFGHNLVMASHADGHPSSLADAHDQMHAPAGSLDHEQSGPTECEHFSLSACGSGHCCFPVPASLLLHARGAQDFAKERTVIAFRHDNRLDPPPPRRA